jgi:phosphoglycerate dehydrogenase-like enzyme
LQEPVVLIGSPLEAELVEWLRAAVPGAQVIQRPELLPEPAFPSDHVGRPRELAPGQLETWRGLLARAEVMFDFDWFSPAQWRTLSPALRWIQGTSAGIGARAQANGHTAGEVLLTTAAGVHAKPLAEFALAGILHFARGFPALERARARHDWGRGGTDTLRGKRALVIGAGGIGHEVARTLDFFGVHCTGTTRSGRALGAPFAATAPWHALAGHDDGPGGGKAGPGGTGIPAGVGIRAAAGLPGTAGILAETDIVVLACPLTEETRGLFGRRELAALKPGAILVNLARGPVLDQAALCQALHGGRLAGAVLDVAEPEPLPAGHPLWDAPNLVISPHNAANVPTENELLVELFAENLRRYIDGRPLRNVYEPERGY